MYQRVLRSQVGLPGELLALGWHFPIGTASKPSPVEGGTDARRGMPLPRSIVVLKQLITDEPNSRAVEPELLYEFVSMVLCTPNAQLVGLALDVLQPLVHLEHFAEQGFGAFPQPEQLGMSHAQQTPIYWTSPRLWHSPSAVRVLPISQRGCWSANCSLVSSGATAARSYRLGLLTSPVNGTRPKARVDGGSAPEVVAAL